MYLQHIENNQGTFVVYSVFINETKANIFLPRKLDSSTNAKPNSLSTLQETIPKLYGRPKVIKFLIKRYFQQEGDNDYICRNLVNQNTF